MSGTHSRESSLEQRPRATHDYRDIGGRTNQDDRVEEAKAEDKPKYYNQIHIFILIKPPCLRFCEP